MSDEVISEEVLQSMGISRPVYEEVQMIVGHLPTVDELSTLLAMWESNGRQTGLLRWLKGQFHVAERHDYLGQKPTDPRELSVRECLERARHCYASAPSAVAQKGPSATPSTPLSTGLELYLVGNILPSERDDRDYIALILSALKHNSIILTINEVGQGGLFAALLRLTQPLGFDLLCCKEVRLDSFLFGEEPGRYIISLPEAEVGHFLEKLTEAGLNCCLLGCVTSGRVVVDGMDFGPSTLFHL